MKQKVKSTSQFHLTGGMYNPRGDPLMTISSIDYLFLSVLFKFKFHFEIGSERTNFANVFLLFIGASVAQGLARAPFTSESGSILHQDSSNFSCEKSMPTLCRKSWVFSGHSGSLPQGRLACGLG